MLEDAIRAAYAGWQHSIEYFNEATEKEDIDFAVYDMEAKRLKYLKLLKDAKKDENNAK